MTKNKRFMELRSAFVEATRNVLGPKNLGRPKDFIHRKIGHLMTLPYSSDPALQTRQMARVNQTLQRAAFGFKQHWGNYRSTEPPFAMLNGEGLQ